MMTDGVTSSEATACAPFRASANGAGAQQRHRQDTKLHAEVEEVEEQEDDNDMPLLFMDRLPSDFATNEQLAAIATFMDDSDTERQCDDDDDDADDIGRGSRADGTAWHIRNPPHQRRGTAAQARRRVAKQKRKQAPYAKEKKRDTTSANDLTLFMNFFKM